VVRERSCAILFQARARGKVLKTFRSEAAGACKVASVLCVPVNKLRGDCFRMEAARPVFQAAYQVFKAYIPGDLHYLAKQESECRAAFQKDPARP
jgi:hypothetical protein